MNATKPFTISKRMVWEAFKAVKANKGSPGVDGQSIEVFEGDLEDNLFRLWNRLASGRCPSAGAHPESLVTSDAASAVS